MNFDNNDNQFELSYEFLFLLKWLIEHEAENLKKMVARSVRQGFKEHLARQTNEGPQQTEMLNSIIDFLDLLDTLLLETMHEENIQKVLDRSLIPALDQIDSHSCDKAMVQGSLDKISEKLEQAPDTNVKDMLFKELLKRWKPQKNILN